MTPPSAGSSLSTVSVQTGPTPFTDSAINRSVSASSLLPSALPGSNHFRHATNNTLTSFNAGAGMGLGMGMQPATGLGMGLGTKGSGLSLGGGDYGELFRHFVF